MITRQWVLAILGELPVVWWPVFLFELYALKRWLATGPVEPGAMLVFGVTPHGLIMLDRYYPPSREATASWTALAPRAPWTRLSPEASSAPAPIALFLHRACTLAAPVLHRCILPERPLRPFAPS
jgi:hypothetical protein